MNTALDWVKNNLHPDGGIRAWTGGPAYPEVTGYLIPTLIAWDERELAVKFADWLVSIQNEDGSFYDMNGIKRSFDTAACMEGLRAIGYYQSEIKARKWLSKQVRKDGAVRVTPDTEDTHLYTMRVSGMLEDYRGAHYWMNHWKHEREHYVAYALEGLWNIGQRQFVEQKLLSRDWLSPDTCANAQFAILDIKAGFGTDGLVDAVRNQEYIHNSWTAKWVLDMEKILDG